MHYAVVQVHANRVQIAVQAGSIFEQNLCWGNGLGIDGYAYPGARRPLWDYKKMMAAPEGMIYHGTDEHPLLGTTGR